VELWKIFFTNPCMSLNYSTAWWPFTLSILSIFHYVSLLASSDRRCSWSFCFSLLSDAVLYPCGTWVCFSRELAGVYAVDKWIPLPSTISPRKWRQIGGGMNFAFYMQQINTTSITCWMNPFLFGNMILTCIIICALQVKKMVVHGATKVVDSLRRIRDGCN
jgi:hypothetical protein